MQPIRVLHVHAGNLYGGVETTLTRLVRHRHLMPNIELGVALVFAGRLAEELSALGVLHGTLGTVRARYPWTVWRARRALTRLIATQPCDVMVFHSAWTLSIFAPVPRGARVGLVFWLHGMGERRSWPEIWARWHQPDLVICNSRYTAASLLPRIFPKARHEVFYPPLSPRSTDHAREETRGRLGAADRVVVLHVGRMEPWKGQSVLLDALARLAHDPRWVCWIAGGSQRPSEEAYAAGLVARAARLGIGERVRFLGDRSDVAALMEAADLVCQPNTGPETFGQVLAEAMASGRAVVTSELGSAPEVMDASCGVLVAPGDPVRLAEALQDLIADPARRSALGAAGPARVRERFAPESQMPLLERYLTSAAAGRR